MTNAAPEPRGSEILPADPLDDESLQYSAADWRRLARDYEAEIDEFPEERVEAWCDAADAWLQAGEVDEAERCYRGAAAEPPEEGLPDPRVHLADFLVDYRDVDSARELLDEIWRSRPRSVGTYYFAAENLESQGSYEQALNWANAGLSRCYPQPFEPEVEDLHSDFELSMLLGTRRRLRQSLQQPEDELDRLKQQELPPPNPIESPEPEAPVSLPDVVLYWPSGEFDEAARSLSHSDLPDSHVEHRRRVEAFLRGCVGRTPLVVSGGIMEFFQFCQEESLDSSIPTSRTEYAVHVEQLRGATSWPPGRNDACWCGSERKYKKCCGAPGFADLAEFADSGKLRPPTVGEQIPRPQGPIRDECDGGELVSGMRDEESH
jgi:hypothetical protein